MDWHDVAKMGYFFSGGVACSFTTSFMIRKLFEIKLRHLELKIQYLEEDVELNRKELQNLNVKN